MPMEPMPQPSEPARAEFGALLERLTAEEPDARAASMFGMPAGKYHRKIFAGMFGDDLVVKLTSDAHADALTVDGAHLFDPSGTGRAMRQWVVLPWERRAAWERFAARALADLKASM